MGNTLPETWKEFKDLMERLGVTDDTTFRRIAIHPWSISGQQALVVDLLMLIGNTVSTYETIIGPLKMEVDPLANEFDLSGLDLNSKPVPPFEMDKFPHLAKGIGWENRFDGWQPRSKRTGGDDLL